MILGPGESWAPALACIPQGSQLTMEVAKVADYYTKTSFSFLADDVEGVALASAWEDPPAELFEDRNYPELGAVLSVEGAEVSIWGEDNPDCWAIAGMIQRFCPSALPVAFSVSWDCSKPRTDAFGGTAWLVTAEAIISRSTNDLIEQMRSEIGKGGD